MSWKPGSRGDPFVEGVANLKGQVANREQRLGRALHLVAVAAELLRAMGASATAELLLAEAAALKPRPPAKPEKPR